MRKLMFAVEGQKLSKQGDFSGIMAGSKGPFAGKAYPHGGIGCILLHHKGGPFNGIWTIGRWYYALHLACRHSNHAGRR